MKKYAESAPIAINFTVDVDQGITIKPKLLTIQQGEHNARYFQVSLVHNDMPINLVNSEVHFLTQPHESDEIPTITNCEIYDVENGQIMVAVKDYMSNKRGIINGEFVRVGKDGSSLPFKNFTISVDGSIFVNDGLGQSEPLHSLVSALARVQRVEEYLEQEFMDVEAKYAGELSKTNAKLSKLENQVDPFTATLSISEQMAELGSKHNLTLSWSYNRDIESQKINNDNLDINIRSKSYSNVSTNTTYTLTATSTLNFTISKSVSITFANGVYYGKSSSTNYDSDLIKSLTKKLSTNKSRTITVNASTNEYIYYCVPARLGECSFNVNGFDGGFDKVATISFTNNFGYKEDYHIYKSKNSNLGNTTVVVK